MPARPCQAAFRRRCRRARPAGGLGDHHHGRAQQPAVQGPGRVQACITVPGGCSALSCSAIAWCRLGSNGCAGRVLALDAVALQQCRRSCARRLRSPRAPWRRSPARRRAAAAGCRGRACRFSAASTTSRGEFLHRVLAGVVHVALGAGAHVGDFRLGAHPAVASSRPARPPARRCGRWRPASAAPACSSGAGRGHRPRARCRRAVLVGCPDVRCMTRQLGGPMPLRQAGEHMAVSRTCSRNFADAAVLQPSSWPMTRAV